MNFDTCDNVSPGRQEQYHGKKLFELVATKQQQTKTMSNITTYAENIISLVGFEGLVWYVWFGLFSMVGVV